MRGYSVLEPKHNKIPELFETILALIVVILMYIVWFIFFMPLTVIYKLFNRKRGENNEKTTRI